ncbi:MAG TPA: PilZ domain-containing protein [Terriglobia bacterium]|nr:PilZ domain-containing protein [Terriglobia bacterium]
MPAAQGAERRRAPRRKVANSLTFIVDSDRDQIANRAFAVDLSDLGARIRAGVRLEPGQLITVVPSEGAAEGIPSQVIWVTPGATTGEAGIAFLEPLAARVHL